MLPAGNDILIQTKLSPVEALEKSVQAIRLIWPDQLVEKGPYGHLIYENIVARTVWGFKGWNQEHAKSLIQLIAREGTGYVTLVIENDSDPILVKIISAIRAVLES
jgi:hypothetical protein